MATTTQEKLTAVVDKLRALPYDTLKLHALSIELPKQIERARQASFIHIIGISSNRQHHTPAPYAPCIDTPLDSGLQAPILDNYRRLLTIKAIVEATPEFAEACAKVTTV